MVITLNYTTLVLSITHEGYNHTAQVENFGHGWIISKLSAVKGQGWNEHNSYLRAKMRKEIEKELIEWCNLNVRV